MSMVIISHYVNTSSNHYVAHLKLIPYINYSSIKKKSVFVSYICNFTEVMKTLWNQKLWCSINTKATGIKTSCQQNFMPVKKGKRKFKFCLATGILRLKFIISQLCFST